MGSATIVIGLGLLSLATMISYASTPTPDWSNLVLGVMVGISLMAVGLSDLFELRGQGGDDEEV